MDRGRFVALAAETRAQLEQIAEIHGRIDERARSRGTAGRESLAYQLHNLCGAIEELFAIVAAAFENQLEGGKGYHLKLLRRMAIGVEGVRPRVISDVTLSRLDALRGFRRVFRHAYTAELDPRRLKLVLDDARSIRNAVPDEVEAFLASVAPE